KMMLGLREEAVTDFRMLLEQVPNYLPALKGLGEAYIGLSMDHRDAGLSSRAADDIRCAVDVIKRCIEIQDDLHCLWKLLGDAHTLHFFLPPLNVYDNGYFIIILITIIV